MAPHPVAPLPAKLQLVSPSALKKPPKILIKSINPHIICYLCKGYLIDATTIVECLHSFCHSCIMKHLQLENYCPRCEMLINKAKPNIKPDATLQAIVYKLVSGLYEKELKRKRAFYREHPYEALLASPEQRGDDTEHLIFSPNEQISLSLEYADLDEITPEDDENENIVELKHPKYLQCPANFPVAYLKKFVINKFNINVKDFYVEIMYKVKTIVLPDHFTLMDVAYIYTWKRDAPMRYFYRVRSHHIETEEVPDVPLRKSPPIQTADENTPLKSVVNESDSTVISNNDSELIKVENKPVKSTHAISNSKNSDSANTSSSEVKKKSKKERNVTNDNEKNDSLKLVIDLANQKVKESPSVNSNNNNSCKSSYNSEQCDKKDELKLKITKIHSSTVPSPKASSPKDKSPKTKEPQTPTKLDAAVEKLSKVHVGKPQDPEKVIEVKKFEFLNSFELTAKKSISDAKPTPSVTTTNSAAKLFTIPTTSSVHHATVTTNAATPDQPKIKITLSKNKPKQMTLSGMLKRKRMSSPNGSTSKVSYKIKDKKSNSVSPPLLMGSKDMNRITSEPTETAKSISFNFAPYPIGTSSSASPNKLNTCVTTSAPSEQKPAEVQSTSVSNQEPKMAETQKSVSPTKTKEDKKTEKQNAVAVPPNKIPTPPPPVLPEVVKLVTKTNSKSEGLMKPPQFPPPSVKRPQPILPKQPVDSQYSNKMMNLAGTEIKKLENNDKNKNVKVYGPIESKPNNKGDKMAPPLLSFTGGVMRNSMSGGFLNYALMNSSKPNKTKMINGGGNGGDSPHPNHIPLSRMTPASHYAGMKSPRYVPNSPIYSPNSPQYAPNYNIPTQPQYKYMKPPVYTSPNFLQNVIKPKNLPSTSNASASLSSAQGTTINHEQNIKPGMKRQLSPLSLYPSTSKKSPKHDKSDNISPPPEKQAKVQSLLDSCKISLPSSLSITLTNDKEDQLASQLFSKTNSSPVNNYIEILKLTENNEEERSFSESLKSLVEEKKLLKPIPNLTPMIKTSNNTSPTTPEPSPNQKCGKNVSSYQECYIQAMENIKMNLNKKLKTDDLASNNKNVANSFGGTKKSNGSSRSSGGNGRPRIKVTGAAKQQQQMMLQKQQQQAQLNQQQTPPTPTTSMEQMLSLQQAQEMHSHPPPGHLPQLNNSNNNLDNLFYSLPQLPAYLNEASRRAFASQLASQLATNRAIWEHKAYENYYYNNNKQLCSETTKDNPTEST